MGKAHCLQAASTVGKSLRQAWHIETDSEICKSQRTQLDFNREKLIILIVSALLINYHTFQITSKKWGGVLY